MNQQLDIILSNCNEPDLGHAPFLDSIATQKGVDLSRVRVILMQNRPEKCLSEEELKNYPFEIMQEMAETISPGVLRNLGLNLAVAPWVMFVDYNDVLATVYSLHAILDMEGANGMDILFMHRFEEYYYWEGAERKVGVAIRRENKLGTVGKLYNRVFLMRNRIRFEPVLRFFVGKQFDLVANACTHCTRFGTITADVVPLLRTINHTPASFTFPLFREWINAHILSLGEMRRRGFRTDTVDQVAKIICDAYYICNRESLPPELEDTEETAWIIYDKYRDLFNAIRRNRLEVIMDCSRREIEYYTSLDITSPPLLPEKPALMTWLQTLDEIYGAKHPKNRRVAVYCGTRNVYDDMVTAAKSLLAHNDMDQVYFLVEDDEFPQPLPAVIQCINVADQPFFGPACPNLNTVWSYMILMRGALTKLFPNEDRILSLDNDTIVEDDLSELFDMDMGDAYIAGVPETGRNGRKTDGHYLNFGVILMNLKRLRETGKDDEIIHSLATRKWGYPEQTCYNELCYPDLLCLAPMYNVATYGYFYDVVPHEKIAHYVALKEYQHLPAVRKYTDLTWPEVFTFRRIFSHERESTVLPQPVAFRPVPDAVPVDAAAGNDSPRLPSPGDPPQELGEEGAPEASPDQGPGDRLVSESAPVLQEQDPLLLSPLPGEDEQQSPPQDPPLVPLEELDALGSPEAPSP